MRVCGGGMNFGGREPGVTRGGREVTREINFLAERGLFARSGVVGVFA